MNNIKDVPKCLICNNDRSYDTFSNGYHNTCGNKKCVNKYRQISIENTNLELYGVKCILQTPENQEKSRKTCLERHGYEFSMQSPKIQQTRKNNTFNKLGVDHHMKTEESVNNMKRTNLGRYGTPSSWASPEIIKKKEKTMLELYNVYNPLCKGEIRDKIIQGWIKKFGEDNPMKNSKVFSSALSKMAKYKEIELPSGKKVKIRGYEEFGINLLLNLYNEEDLNVTNEEIELKIGKIYYYTDDNKKHRYFPDIYIESENKIIEIKSEWTYTKYLESNILKKDAILKANINFEFMIFDKFGNLIKRIS